MVVFGLRQVEQRHQIRWRNLSEQAVPNVAGIVATHIKRIQPIEDAALQAMLQVDPQIGYIIVHNHLSGFLTSAVNAEAMSKAPFSIADRALKENFSALAKTLFQNQQGGMTLGFDVLRIELRDKQLPTRPIQAVIKMGYVMPGYRSLKLSLWTMQGLLVLSVLVLLLALLIPSSSRKSVAEIEEVDLLSDSLTTDQTEVISLSQPRHVNSERWLPMLTEEGLDNWQRSGEWYIFNEFVVANPWRASLVRTDFNFEQYVFRLKAKKISGADGFVVLFQCDNHGLVWVLGGWNNSRSEVAGYKSTQYVESIKTDRWYEITIEVFDSVLNGYVNGDKKWSLSRKEIKASDVGEDFLTGIGMGVWNTVCKFQNPFIVNKDEQSI